MAPPISPESDPLDPIISVSTTEIGTDTPPPAAEAEIGLTPNAAGDAILGNAGPAPGVQAGVEGPADEVVIWEDRYSLGNFIGRAIIGGLLILGCLYLIYEVSEQGYLALRPLVYLLGVATTGYWLWLAFRIFRARFRHYYRLTSHRLFVSTGIFRSRQDMMELEHLKEVTIQQSHFLSHLLKIATVAVASNVNGAPTLYLVGIKDAQRVVDLIYLNARK